MIECVKVGTLCDREEISVQVGQLVGRLLPEHFLLVPCLDLPEFRQFFLGSCCSA